MEEITLSPPSYLHSSVEALEKGWPTVGRTPTLEAGSLKRCPGRSESAAREPPGQVPQGGIVGTERAVAAEPTGVTGTPSNKSGA